MERLLQKQLSEMKNNIYLIIAALLFCFAFAFYFKYQDATTEISTNSATIDSLQYKYDSVRDELFSTEVQLNRYQITLENMDSVTKEKFEAFLYTQTE